MENFVNGTLSSPYNYEKYYPKEKNVADLLVNKALKNCQNGLGEAKWITDAETGEFILFSKVEPLSRTVASALFKRGLRRGDIVLYNTSYPARLHVFFLGVWRANGALRSIYLQESEDTVAERIIECKAKFFLCDQTAVGTVRGALKKVPWEVDILVFGNVENCISMDTILQDAGDACPVVELEETDIAVILPTSGTTGASKGAAHTHAGVKKSLVTYELASYFHAPNNPFFLLAKPTHTAGFMLPFLTLSAGGKILTMRNISSENILKAVHTYKPSTVFGFPPFLLCLANPESAKTYDLTSIKIIACGGIVISPSYIATMESIPEISARVVTSYAMTECGALVTSKNGDPVSGQIADTQIIADLPPFSTGKLVAGTSLQVRDLDTNECLGPNKTGELYFKSPIACAGYYNNPEETKLGLPDGWLKTGDVGYFDENGFIFVVDRSKEIFKYLNDHISPSEVEDVIKRHEAVEDVCVIGIVDPAGGDRIPRAFVTLKNPEASADDIRKFANDNLTSYKQLRGGLIVLPSLPLGKTGKVSREILGKVQLSIPPEMST